MSPFSLLLLEAFSCILLSFSLTHLGEDPNKMNQYKSIISEKILLLFILASYPFLVGMFGIGIPELIVIIIILAIPASIVICILLLTRDGAKTSITKEVYMYCTKCGTKNDDNAFKCVNCGNDLQHLEQIEISNYLVQAILVTIFCCLPFGIPAIVFAAQVNGKLEAGDYDGAIKKSKQAKRWCWVSFWVGIGIIIFYILMMMIPIIAGA
jgi:hypothetical protein